jgi:hypothetical protein
VEVSPKYKIGGEIAVKFEAGNEGSRVVYLTYYDLSNLDYKTIVGWVENCRKIAEEAGADEFGHSFERGEHTIRIWWD